jgi:hypothetical protein
MAKTFLLALCQAVSGCVAYFGSAAVHNVYTGHTYAAGPAALLTVGVALEFFLLYIFWRAVEPKHTWLLRVMLLLGPLLFCPAAIFVPAIDRFFSGYWLTLLPVTWLDVQMTPFGWALDLAVLVTLGAEGIIEALEIEYKALNGFLTRNGTDPKKH